MTQSINEGKTVRFITWNAAQIQERSAHLRSLGFAVNASPISADALREMRQNPPAAFVIDLSRQPSGGRDIAINLRLFKTTRLVPLLFIEGEPDKTGQIRTLLPDAHFTSWVMIASAMRTALAHPPSNPTIPASGMAAYAGVSLAKKLGIKPEGVVALVDAPLGFTKKLEPLPVGTKVVGNATDSAGLTLWFVRSEQDMLPQAVMIRSGGWSLSLVAVVCGLHGKKRHPPMRGVSRRHWCESSPSVPGWWISRSARWMTPGRACASRWPGTRPPEERNAGLILLLSG